MAIEFKQVNYFYNYQTKMQTQALFDINIKIENQQIVAIIGKTGSGKSTLIQHINGLLKPQLGSVEIDDLSLDADSKNETLFKIRQKIGMTFQFAENQLFASSVLEDAKFGPLNFGQSQQEAEENAKKALKQVGIDEKLFDQSPFDLSGGQMRKVALAGILSYQPETIIFDEPTVGLDPKSANDVIELIRDLKAKQKTQIIVSHDMNLIWQLADKVVVLDRGRIIAYDSPEAIFNDQQIVEKMNLQPPVIFDISKKIGLNQGKRITNFAELAQAIKKTV